MRLELPSHIGAAPISLLVLLAFPTLASAQSAPGGGVGAGDDKASCVDAFDQAQRDQAEGHLLDAQRQLLLCTRPVCGTGLMSECTQMYSEIERALPSVVLSAHDEASNTDLTEVTVTLNGERFANSLDGKPIAIDPGEYEFVFSAPGHDPIKRRAVVGTGDKYRAITVAFPDLRPAPRERAMPPATPSGLQASPRPDDLAHPVPVMSWVLGGVAVVGVGAGAVLRIVGNSDFDSMKEGCAAQGCPESDIDKLEQKFVISNVAFGAGAAAAAGAVLWYLLDAPSREQGTLAILPAPDGRGAFASAQGRF
ncbi:MAG TPA: hypothetical protein VMG12_42860 [Polyangiaceae bacterium]|nr:hypothetical protein [Polyangiaceae bacterium]